MQLLPREPGNMQALLMTLKSPGLRTFPEIVLHVPVLCNETRGTRATEACVENGRARNGRGR